MVTPPKPKARATRTVTPNKAVHKLIDDVLVVAREKGISLAAELEMEKSTISQWEHGQRPMYLKALTRDKIQALLAKHRNGKHEPTLSVTLQVTFPVGTAAPLTLIADFIKDCGGSVVDTKIAVNA